MATSGSDLVKDMRHIHEFLDAQKKLVSAETMGKMQDGQAHSFARQLEMQPRLPARWLKAPGQRCRRQCWARESAQRLRAV